MEVEARREAATIAGVMTGVMADVGMTQGVGEIIMGVEVRRETETITGPMTVADVGMTQGGVPHPGLVLGMISVVHPEVMVAMAETISEGVVVDTAGGRGEILEEDMGRVVVEVVVVVVVVGQHPVRSKIVIS